MPRRLVTYEGLHRDFDSQGDLLQRFSALPCLRCGECCVTRRPLLSPEDVHRIATGLGLTPSAFTRRYLRKHPTKRRAYLFRQESGDCPFLQRQGCLALCSIHEFKPEACRRWEASLGKPECVAGLRRLLQQGDREGLQALYPDPLERGRFLGALAQGGGEAIAKTAPSLISSSRGSRFRRVIAQGPLDMASKRQYLSN